MKTITKFNLLVILISGILTVTTHAQTNVLPSSGNVGIGTPSPSTKLEVNGCATFDSMVVMQDSLKLKESLVVDQDILIKGNSTFSGNLNLTLFEAPQLSYDRFMLIKSNGQLKSGGIDVLYKEECVPFIDPNGNVSQYPTPVWASLPGTNQPVGKLWTGATCPVLVGIGTDDPQARIDVIGDSHFSGSMGIGHFADPEVRLVVEGDKKVGLCVNHLYNDDYGYGVKSIVNNDLTKAFGVFNTTNGANGEDVFRVYGNGAVECKKVKVSLTIWADHVFDDAYDLMPLDTLSDYIATHKHLPNVPSEETVLNEGIDLGKQNAVLLEKVEELTLYIIDLNERLAELEAQSENAAAAIAPSPIYDANDSTNQ